MCIYQLCIAQPRMLICLMGKKRKRSLTEWNVWISHWVVETSISSFLHGSICHQTIWCTSTLWELWFRPKWSFILLWLRFLFRFGLLLCWHIGQSALTQLLVSRSMFQYKFLCLFPDLLKQLIHLWFWVLICKGWVKQLLVFNPLSLLLWTTPLTIWTSHLLCSLDDSENILIDTQLLIQLLRLMGILILSILRMTLTAL